MPRLYWFNTKYVRFALHILFFIFSFYILLSIFKTGSRAEKIDWLYTALFLFFIIPVVYINLYLLLPRLAKETSWPWYISSLLAIITLFTWTNLEFFRDWSSSLMPDWFFISYYTWWEIAFFFAAFIAVTTLLKLSKSWFIVNDLNRQLLLAEKEKVQIELRALKAQINPHFFFNTLNGIYSMSLDKDERLPDTVLQLSGLMRYFLYDSREDFVPLDKEWKMLQNYIALQRIRFTEKLEVEILVEGTAEGKKIAPLLLITFVENAFKHGVKVNAANAYIKMKMQIVEKELNFHVENNKFSNGENSEIGYAGVGLSNVKRRLELLYPQKHSLLINETNESFNIKLQLILE